MTRPPHLSEERWQLLRTAFEGDAAGLRQRLAAEPAPVPDELEAPLLMAVREGHEEVVALLLEAGADPTGTNADGDALATIARDRGHGAIQQRLDVLVAEREPPPRDDHAVHDAASRGDAPALAALLDRDPTLVERRDVRGATPLHLAVAASARGAIALLLDRGADVQARHGPVRGPGATYVPAGFEPADVALWDGPSFGVRGDLDTIDLLIARGAPMDLTLAAATGDGARVEALLAADPACIASARPCGKRPLSTAIQLGHGEIARRLLAAGADPTWPEGAGAPRGLALHAAAAAGDAGMVELLLGRGADPSAHVDSAGNPTYAARTPELRRLLVARGGWLSPCDLVWLHEDDEAVARIAADPAEAGEGCGSVLAAACARGEPRLLRRLLDAGARVPPSFSSCRRYLLEEPELLRMLLDAGMDPDLPSWLGVTLLHELCGRDGRGRELPKRAASAELLLAAGARRDARDEEHRSTPLGWAARSGLLDMVELLLARGAPSRLPDDPPWATPLQWALRRGHDDVAARLRAAAEG